MRNSNSISALLWPILELNLTLSILPFPCKDSINIAPLSGTVALKGLVFVNRDVSIRAVDGFIRVRWWLSSVKKKFEDSNSCRVELELNGVEAQLFNNATKYEQLRRALSKARRAAQVAKGEEPTVDDFFDNMDDVVDLQDIMAVEAYKPSFFHRLSPVLKVVVHKGSLIIGNPLIQPLLSVRFRTASVRYTTEPATHPTLDYSQTRVRVDLSTVTAKLIEHTLYQPAASPSTANALAPPPQGYRKFPGFLKFLKRMNLRFLANTFENLAAEHLELDPVEQPEGETQPSAVSGGSKAKTKKQRKVSAVYFSERAWKRLRKAEQAIYKTAEPLLQVSNLRLEYFIDAAGPIVEIPSEEPLARQPGHSLPNSSESSSKESKKKKKKNVMDNDSDDTDEEAEEDSVDTSAVKSLTPRQGLIVTASEGNFTYGPQENRLRAILQGFFFPPVPPPAEAPRIRQHEYFEVEVRIEKAATIKIPFKGPNNISQQHQEATIAAAAAAFSSMASSPVAAKLDSPAATPPAAANATPSAATEWMQVRTGPAHVIYNVPMKPKLLNRIQIQVDPDWLDPQTAGVSHFPSDSSSSSSSSSSSKKSSSTSENSSNHTNNSDSKAEEEMTDLSNPRILVTTSLHPDEPWMHVSSIAVDLTLDIPQNPTELGRWIVDTRLCGSKLFFLRDHADLFARLGQDFAVPASQFSPHTFEQSLANHRPMQYDIHVSLKDQFAIHLNMNERNIIDELKNMKLNSFYTLKGPTLAANISVPMLKFQQHFVPVSLEAAADDLSIVANHCERSTMKHLYETSNDDDPSNFLYARSLKMEGDMRFDTGNANILPSLDGKLITLTDAVELQFEADFVRMKAVGAHMNLFDRFLDNYVGGYAKSTKTPPPAPNGSFSSTPINTPRENFPKIPQPSEIQRKTDVNISVRVRHPTVSLPLNLYSDQVSAIAECNEVHVQVRAGGELTLAIGVTPATIYLPQCGSSIVTKPVANVNSVGVELLWRKAKIEDVYFGEKVLRDVTYRECIKVDVGDVQLAVEPIHVLRVLDGVLGLFYSLFNRDNRPGYLKNAANPYDKYKHTTIYLNIHGVIAKIWGPRGVVQVSTPGVKMALDSLYGPTHSKFLRLRVPSAKVGIYSIESSSSAAKKSFSSSILPEAEKWLEVGAIHVPTVIVRHSGQLIDPELSLHVKQLEFLRRCDELRGRLLLYLWEPEEQIWSRDPFDRPWIRNFFEYESFFRSKSTSPDTLPSLVERIFEKIVPFDEQDPTPSGSGTNSALNSARRTSSTNLRASNRSRAPSVTGPPTLQTQDGVAVGTRLMPNRLQRQPSIGSPTIDTIVEIDQEDGESSSSSSSDSESDSESSFYSASDHSSSISSSSASLHDATDLRASQAGDTHVPPAKPKVAFNIDDDVDEESADDFENIEDPTMEIPVSALLDRHFYDVQGGSTFPETDQLGEFVCDWSPEIALSLDPKLNSLQTSSSSVPSSQPGSARGQAETQNAKAPEGFAEDPENASTTTKKKKKKWKTDQRIQSPSSSSVPPKFESEASPSDPKDSSKNQNETFENPAADCTETNEVGTAVIRLTRNVDAHLTPQCLVVFSDAVDQVVHEKIMVQTVFDRLQMWLVRQMAVSSNQEAGHFSFVAVLLQVAGVRISLLQTHIGEIATNYITSLTLGSVVFSMKLSSEAIRPAVYANVRYEMPALVVDTRSRDMSLTLSKSTITVEQLEPEYAQHLLDQLIRARADSEDSRETTRFEYGSIQGSFAPNDASSAFSRPSTGETDKTKTKTNSKVVFSATLTDSLQFLHRFVAPSYLATREAATFVNMGKVEGFILDEFGAFVASLVRAWTPSISALISAVSGIPDKMRLSHLVLYELLVQLRDVDIKNDPYDAFGRSSEANRTAWMLIYVTRQRLLGSISRMASDSRLTAGQVKNSTLVSVEAVRAFDLVESLKPHHMPPLLAGCIDLDYTLHHILTNDPDIVGSHFLIDELFLKRAQTTRQRFNVRIEGLVLHLPSLETSRTMPDEATRGEIVLLPVDVSALTKVSVRLPAGHDTQLAHVTVQTPATPAATTSATTGKGLSNSQSTTIHPTSSPPHAPHMRTSSSRRTTIPSLNRQKTVADDLFISSSEQIMTSSGGGSLGVRVLAPVTLSETQFLANSKGVKINITPRILDLAVAANKRWKASESKKELFHVRPLPRSTGTPARFALLEQMVRVSGDLFRQASRDKQAISGHLVSDAFSARASSRYGSVSLDIPETTVSLSSLPESTNGSHPASHTLIVRLPVLKFAALIDGRRHLGTSTIDFSEAPISMELSKLAACIMFTPSGISIVEEEGGNTKEYRAHNVRPRASATHSKRPSRDAKAMPKPNQDEDRRSHASPRDKDNVFDALDIVIQSQSLTLPFRLPHPVYTQFLVAEWTSRLSGSQQPQQGASEATENPSVPPLPLKRPKPSNTTANKRPGHVKHNSFVPTPFDAARPGQYESSHLKKKRRSSGSDRRSRSSSGSGNNGEGEKPVLPFLTRKVRATFHGHFSNISFLMTQLADLPVKYHVPEVAILSRHAEHEHAFHVSIKSHSISFEPKKTKVSVDSENFDFVSTRVTLVELPAWTIESTVRQYLTDPKIGEEESSKASTSKNTETSPSGTRAKRSRSVHKVPTMPKILRTDIQSSISIHHVRNVLRAAVIKNILVFQATLRREIQSVMAVLEEAKLKAPKKPEETVVKDEDQLEKERLEKENKDVLAVFRMWPNVRWRIDIDWKGLEVQVESPHATIMLYTGHLRAAAVSRSGSSIVAPSSNPLSRKKSSKTSSPSVSKRKQGVEVLQDAAAGRKRSNSKHSSKSGSSVVDSVAKHNPFDFRITLSYITALLCPPNTKGSIYNPKRDVTETGKLDVWAGLSTNVTAQSFVDNKFVFKHSKTATQPGNFQSWWIAIDKTHVLIQPWVGEKALLMWLYFSEYHSTIVGRKNGPGDPIDLATARNSTATLGVSAIALSHPTAAASGTSSATASSESGSQPSGDLPLEGTNATVFVQVTEVGVLVPCNSLKNASSRLPLSLQFDPRFNVNTVLLLRLERFTFSGSTHSLNQRTLTLFKPNAPAKPKRTQILANAVLSGLTVGFDVMDYEKLTLSLEEDALYKPPKMNHILMSEADCRFVFVKESQPLPMAPRGPSSRITRYGPAKIVGAIELTTTGLKVKFNAQIYSHVAVLVKNVELGQTQFTAILDELNRQQQKEELAKPSPHTSRRPRGGTVSVRGLAPPPPPDTISPNAASSTSKASIVGIAGHAPSSSTLLKPVLTQQSFQLDVTLVTTAGTVEVYACTSATKADASNQPLKPKAKKTTREAAIIDEDSAAETGRASSFRMPSPPLAGPPQTEFTLLECIPLPQVRATYSKNYTSSTRTNTPSSAPSTSSSATQTPGNLSSSPSASQTLEARRNNSNVIAVGIEGIDCTISPDLVIFYHELLAQMAVMKGVLKDDDRDGQDAEESDEEKFNPSLTQSTLPMLFSTNAEASNSPSKSNSKESTSASVQQPIDKDETWTIHFHLRPSSLRVTSRPYSETTCAFKTGDLTILYQSAYVLAGKDTGSTSNSSSNSSSISPQSSHSDRQRVQQKSLLFKIDCLSLKMENPHFDREDLSLASLEIGSIQLLASHTLITERDLPEQASSMGQTQLNSSSATHKSQSSGTASHSSSSGEANPLTVLLTVDSCIGFFSVRHLQETLLFFKVWQQGIYLVQYADFFGNYAPPAGPNAANTSNGAQNNAENGIVDASESSTADSSSMANVTDIKIGVLGMLLEESAILLNVEIHAVQFVTDLGPSLASVTAEVDYLIASVSAPGRSKIDPLGEIFDLVLQAGPINLSFKGSIEGAIMIQQIGAHGRRVLSVDPTKPAVSVNQNLQSNSGSGHLRRPSSASSNRKAGHRRTGSNATGGGRSTPFGANTSSVPNLVGRSIWSATISPMETSLNYSLSPVLTMKCGDIVVAAFDSWRRKESEDEFADEEMDYADELDDHFRNPADIWEAVTNISASLGPVELAISSETISMPTNVAKRLSDSIRKSNEKANSTLKSMEQLIVVRRDLRKMKFQAGVGAKPLDRLQQLKSLAHAPRLAFRDGSISISIKDESKNVSHHHGASSSHPSGAPDKTSSGAANNSSTANSGGHASISSPAGNQPSSNNNNTSKAGSNGKKRRIAIGSVKLVASSLNVRVFSFSLRDPSWFQLKLASFQLGLVQQVQKMNLLGASSSDIPLSGSGSSVIIRRGSGAFDSPLMNSSASSGITNTSAVLVTLSQELQLVVGGAKLSKITEPRNLGNYGESGQISEPVLVIPATTLVQVSSQDVGSPEIEVYFMTKFENAIRVSIKLSLYTELKDTVTSYQRAIQASKSFLQQQRPGAAAAGGGIPSISKIGDGIAQNRGTTIAGAGSGLRTSRKKSSVSPSIAPSHNRILSGGAAPNPTSVSSLSGGMAASSSQTALSSSKSSKTTNLTVPGASLMPSAPASGESPSKNASAPSDNNADPNAPKNEANRVFVIKKFDFDPSVDVLGDFTPHISTVLGWLGIKDGATTIPKAIHNITDILELALTQTDKVSRIVTKQRTRWKNHMPSSSSHSSKHVSASPSAADLHTSPP